MDHLKGWLLRHTDSVKKATHLMLIMSMLMLIFAFLSGEMQGEVWVAWSVWWLLNLAMFLVVHFNLAE